MKRGLLALIALAALAAPALSAARPALRLIRRAPLEVRGTGFRPHERVTVSSGSYRVRVRTSSSGQFAAQFPFADRCSGGRVIATARGQRAVLYVPPVLCPVAGGEGAP
jgi:hypothetical protein